MQEEKKYNVLIEIAAQHPLNADGTPGKEFECRLNKGIELYNKEKEKGNIPLIYVPGSQHMDKDTVDINSLSTAGKNYLLKNGMPEEDIRGDDANKEYKGEDGVYNSGDECYVAACIAKKEKIERIISVVSPVQILRKVLFYLNYGVFPEMYGERTRRNIP